MGCTRIPLCCHVPLFSPLYSLFCITCNACEQDTWTTSATCWINTQMFFLFLFLKNANEKWNPSVFVLFLDAWHFFTHWLSYILYFFLQTHLIQYSLVSCLLTAKNQTKVIQFMCVGKHKKVGLVNVQTAGIKCWWPFFAFARYSWHTMWMGTSYYPPNSQLNK